MATKDQIERILYSIEYMEQNLFDSMNMGQISQQAFYSEGAFFRIFSKLTHQSPHQYLLGRRMNFASKELLHSNKSLEYIAHLMNYESPEAFCKVFKKFHGQSPIRYRKQAQEIWFQKSYKLTERYLDFVHCSGISASPIRKRFPTKKIHGWAKLLYYDESPVFYEFVIDKLLVENKEFSKIYFFTISTPEMHQKRMGFTVIGLGEMDWIPLGSQSFAVPFQEGLCFENAGSWNELPESNRLIWVDWMSREGHHLQMNCSGGVFDVLYDQRAYVRNHDLYMAKVDGTNASCGLGAVDLGDCNAVSTMEKYWGQ